MKKYIILLFLLSSGAVLSSCDSKLNAPPTQSVVDDNLISDLKTAEAAVNGIYYMYGNCGEDNYTNMTTKIANILETPYAQYAGIIVYYQGPQPYSTHALTAESTNALWFYHYAVLNAANGVIEQLRDKPEEWFPNNRKQELLGACHFMRAVVHYNLMRFFAYSFDLESPYGVLIRTEASRTSNLRKARSTVRESYDQIFADIDYAISNCQDEGSNIYANKWSARFLKIRALMLRGTDADLTLAASMADDFIRDSPFSLEPDVEDIFHSKGLSSNEIVFGMQPYDNQVSRYEAYFYRASPQYYPTDEILELFENDPRLDWYFAPFPETTVPVITKFVDPDEIAASVLEESIYHMRLTEIYLLRAEALAKLGNDLSGAKNLLKTVLGCAGVTDFTEVDNASTQTDVLRLIMHETLRNLCLENGLEHDVLLRMPQSLATTFNPYYANIQYCVFPIPKQEFYMNPGIGDQNPGYSKE